MLSGPSFLTYQHAPLKSIRDAIQDNDHHIVRVAEEGTGEIYDLNLSHSKPYASPVPRNLVQDEKNATALSTNATGDVSTDKKDTPSGEKQKSHEISPIGTAKSSQASSDRKGPTSSSATDYGDKSQSSSSTTVDGFSSSSTGQRMLKLPGIVSRRQAASNKSTKDPQNGVTSSPSDANISVQNAQDIHSEHKADGYVRSGLRHPIVGDLPPSPPLEPDMQQFIAGDGSAIQSKKARNRAQNEEQASRAGRSKPKRSTTEGSVPTRSHMNRDPSFASDASTAYMTASSHSDEEEAPTNSRSTSFMQESKGPLTAEPTSFLQPSYFSQNDTPLARRLSPSLSGSPSTSAVPRMPPRRNTTGTSSLHTKRRPSSVGSTVSQTSRHSSREREQGASNSIYEEPGTIPLSLVNGTPVRTGDAGFDEAIASKYDQIRRERESKKIRELQASPVDTENQPENQLWGGIALNRAKSGRRPGDEEPKALIGNVIGEEHVNYVLMYNMLTGIRIGVSRCQAKMKRPLTDADYQAKHKFTFDIVGNELTPKASYDFKFKDYAPWVFRELREYFHLDAADYLFSLTAKYILSELGSPGKSGSFFYFSRDYRFIIKTIRHNEHKFLRRILKDYHMHIKENPHTLISRLYGLHRVKLPGGKKIHFVIMNNLFPPHKDIHETYDLKGSAIGREYPEEKAAQKKGAVLKDLNWIKRGRELELGPAKCAVFEAQVRSDVALLQRLGIMDYSLLIGLHDMKRGNKEGLRQDALQVVQPDNNPPSHDAGPHGSLRRDSTRKEKEAYALRAAVRRSDAKALGSSSTAKLPERETSDRHHFIFYQDEGGFRSTDANNEPTDWIYYFGIIDTLTLYSGVKRSEHYFKSLTNNSRMISAISPVPYGTRFCNFLFSVIKGGDKSIRPRMQ